MKLPRRRVHFSGEDGVGTGSDTPPEVTRCSIVLWYESFYSMHFRLRGADVGGPVHYHLCTLQCDQATTIISLRSGRILSIASAVSTTSTIIGKSSESRSTFSVCTWLLDPKPAIARTTVAPAMPRSRNSPRSLVERLAMVLVAFPDEGAHECALALESVRHDISPNQSRPPNA